MNKKTDKTEKAHQLNIPILTKEEFLIKFYNYFNQSYFRKNIKY